MKKIISLFGGILLLCSSPIAKAQTAYGHCYTDTNSSSVGGTYLVLPTPPCAPTSATFTNIYKPKETYIPSATGFNPFSVNKTMRIRIKVINPYVDPSGTQVNFKAADKAYLQSVVDRVNYLLINNQAPSDGVTIAGRNPHIADTRLRLTATDIEFVTHDYNYGNLGAFTPTLLTNGENELNVFILWDEDVFPSSTAPAGGVAVGSPAYPYSAGTDDDLIAGKNDGMNFIILKGIFQCTGVRYDLNWTANLLLHEIGHQLGLHHTYGTDWGSVTGTEIDESGYDFLADVFNTGGAKKYPRPANSGHCQSMATASISSNDYWINNFMSGNPEGSNISPMQLGRIHRNAHFLSCRKYFYNTEPEDNAHNHTGMGQLNPVIVNSNQTWDFDIKMYNDIVVKTGATLTITCRVYMPFYSNIIVEKGAKLIIDGGTISSDRKNTMWYGISVLGQQHIAQDVAGAQGIIEMKNGATITDAMHAITLGNAVGGAYTTTSAGGIARIKDARFINNRNSIHFMDYENKPVWPAGSIKPNRSYVTNTLFLLDDDYKTNLSFIKGPQAQIAASGVRGIQILGCNFDNQMSSTTRATFGSGYGIHSHNGGFVVSDYCPSLTVGMPCTSTTLVPSNIKGFEIGVFANSVAIADKPVWVQSTTIENNTFGIYAGAVNTADIHHNKFIVKDPNDITTYSNPPVGLRLETSSLFNVQENTFENQEYSTHYFPIYAPLPWYGISIFKAGVLVDRCGSDNNVIRRNTYDYLMVGNYSRKLNTNGYKSWWTTEAEARGLEFQCNTYNLNSNDQYVLGSDATNHGMRVYQGSALKPAGNTFIDASYPVGAIHDYKHYIFGLDGTSGLVLAQNIQKYYYKSAATPNQELLRYDAAHITKVLTDKNPGCGSIYGGSGGSTSIVGGASSTVTHASFMAALNDTTENRSGNLHTIYAAMNSPYANLDNSLLYLSEANYTAAFTSYNAIAQAYDMLPEEAAEFEKGRLFVNMVARHYQAGISMDSLSATDIDTLHFLVNNATMWAKTKACRWLEHAIGETCVPESIEMPATTSGSNNLRRGNDNTVSFINEDEVSISPNPSATYFDIRYKLMNEKNAEIVVTDVSGRKISTLTLDYHKANTQIDARNWASGVYLYIIRQGDKTISNGKLIKQ